MTPTKLHKSFRISTIAIAAFTVVSTLAVSAEATCPCNQRMENKLKSAYTYYTDSSSVLEFKFQVKKQNGHVDVTLVGQNFGPWEGDWSSRNEKAFLGYLGAIGQDVSKQMERSVVKFRIIDLKNNEFGKFQYGK